MQLAGYTYYAFVSVPPTFAATVAEAVFPVLNCPLAFMAASCIYGVLSLVGTQDRFLCPGNRS